MDIKDKIDIVLKELIENKKNKFTFENVKGYWLNNIIRIEISDINV